jgi:hypothetical protein
MKPSHCLIVIGLTASCLLLQASPAAAGAASPDGLTCYKYGKDLNDGLFVTSASIDHYLLAPRDCEIGKPALHCTQTIVDNDDDPNGGPAGDFVCYKLKCADPSADSYGVASVTQFGAHLGDIKTKKPMLCVPVETDLVP